MDDSIILDSKIYISVSRVSKKCGYNSDYLGQLCRAGKLDCKLISRSWYITEESLFKYTKQNGRKTNAIQKLALDLGVLKSDRGSESNLFFDENQKFIFSQINKQHTALSLLRQKLFPAALIFKSIFSLIIVLMIVTSLVSLLNDNLNFISHSIQNPEYKKEYLMSNIFTPTPLQKATPAKVWGFKQQANTGALQQFKIFLNKKLLIAQNKLEVFFKFLSGGKEKTYLVQNDLDINNNFNSSYKSESGAVMIPIPETDTANLSKVRNYLRNSFSDEIEIVPDESGVSGVIKPVFSDPNKEEYFYVMVPVR